MRTFSGGFLLGACLLTACSEPHTPRHENDGPGSTPSPAAGTLRIALGGEPGTLDPAKAEYGVENFVLNSLFYRLVELDPHGKVIPAAAERWSFSPDGLTLTFELREGLVWSDGTPMDARDFLYSLRRIADPRTASFSAFLIEEIVNAKAINEGRMPVESLGVAVPADDPLRLILTLTNPSPNIVTLFSAFAPGTPLPRHVIEAHPDDWTQPSHWVSNGPYLLQAWRPQEYIDLVPNPLFHETMRIRHVRFIPTANPLNAYNRFRSGDIHVTTNLPTGEIEPAAQAYPDAIRIADSFRITYLVFNTTAPPFENANLRKALAMVIDPNLITDKVITHGYRASLSYVPDTVDDYQPAFPPHVDQTLEERRIHARALLEAEGYTEDSPLNITLRYIGGGIDTKKVMVAVLSLWKAIGVHTRLQQSELKVHYDDLESRDYQAALVSWGGGNSAVSFLREYAQPDPTINLSGYHSEAFLARWQAGLHESDLTKRSALFHEAEQILLADYPVVPLLMNQQTQLVSPALDGWHANTPGIHPIRFMSWRH